MENISIKLLFLIIGFAAAGYQFNTSAPTNYLINLICRLIKKEWLHTLLTCLTCSTFWIAFIGLLCYGYRIDIAILGGCVSSFLITYFSNTVKFYPTSKNGTAN